MIAYFRQIELATQMLWLAWFMMVLGLFLLIITIPTGDPKIGSLVMFLGLHEDAYGWQVALVLLIAPFKHSGWVVFSIPIWLGLVSPVVLLIKSKAINRFIALIYGVGTTTSVVLVMSLKVEGILGIGYYFWMMALCLLTASRLKVSFCSESKVP